MVLANPGKPGLASCLFLTGGFSAKMYGTCAFNDTNQQKHTFTFSASTVIPEGIRGITAFCIGSLTPVPQQRLFT